MDQTTDRVAASPAPRPVGEPESAPQRIGKYHLEQFLGGGMSHVYRAKDTVLGRRVAIKILTEKGLEDPEVKARFLQEARFASNIQHENIISIFDFGVEAHRPFMVMEYVEGKSLRAAIKDGTTGDLNTKLRVAIQVGRALDFIHANKVVHRDVKPENVHVDPAGRVRLMDFGIASAAPPPEAGPTAGNRSDQAVGTPYYMAPEQVLGQPLTKQADVYSFGVLFYELLTGERAVDGADVDQIFHKILYDELNLDLLKENDVPDSVIGVVARCTSKQLAQRPRSLGEVCDGLEKLVGKVNTSTGKHPAARPGMLSPSVARPEGQRVQLSMKPPPGASSIAGSGSNGSAAGTGNPVPGLDGKTKAPQANSPENADAPSRPAFPTDEEIEQGKLPWYMEILPKGLQTPTGLMLVAAGSMMFMMMAIFWLMARMGVI